MGCNGPVATETRGDDATLLMGCGKATGGEGGKGCDGCGSLSGCFARHWQVRLAPQMALAPLAVGC